MTDTCDAQAIIDTAIAAAKEEQLVPGDLMGVTVPEGAEHQILDLEPWAPRPRRKRATVALFTAASLGQYVNAHKTDTESSLWGNVERLTIVGVLNGHAEGGDDAGWGDHRATFTARLTREWQAWSAINGQYKAQTAFAEFLEDHTADVVDPSAADLLELAKTFEATSSAEFKGAVRLDNGQRQITYVESVEARAGQRGQITIPETIELGLVPYEGADRYKVNARFRYRLSDGHLLLGVVLDRPDLVLQNAFEQTLASIEETTQLTAYRGTPA